jgi:hypothetical protein
MPSPIAPPGVRSLSVGAERQYGGCGQQPPSSSFVPRAERERSVRSSVASNLASRPRNLPALAGP